MLRPRIVLASFALTMLGGCALALCDYGSVIPSLDDIMRDNARDAAIKYLKRLPAESRWRRETFSGLGADKKYGKVHKTDAWTVRYPAGETGLAIVVTLDRSATVTNVTLDSSSITGGEP